MCVCFFLMLSIIQNRSQRNDIRWFRYTTRMSQTARIWNTNIYIRLGVFLWLVKDCEIEMTLVSIHCGQLCHLVRCAVADQLGCGGCGVAWTLLTQSGEIISLSIISGNYAARPLVSRSSSSIMSTLHKRPRHRNCVRLNYSNVCPSIRELRPCFT